MRYDPVRVVETRLKRGMLQGAVASKLGVDRTTVYRAETGRASLEMLHRLAELFEVPIALFFLPRGKRSKDKLAGAIVKDTGRTNHRNGNRRKR